MLQGLSSRTGDSNATASRRPIAQHYIAGFWMVGVRTYQTGDRVVFAAEKRTAHPGPRARDVRPEVSGEGYHYHVDKFWLVREVRPGQVVLATRRGKLHVVSIGDQRLRFATWWERLFYTDRFPQAPPSSPLIAS